MVKKAFDFVKITELHPKPRQTGIIEMRGPYYAPITYGYLKDLLDDWGEYIDGVKFAGGSQRLLSLSRVKQIIKLCHDHDLYVSTGGFIERVAVQGSSAIDQYLEECKELGFDVVEVSSGLAPITLEDKVRMVKQVKKLGMKPKPEITMMFGAGAGPRVAGYEMKMRKLEDVIAEVKAHQKVGAEIFMFESEGVTEDMPPETWRVDVIKKLVDEFGYKIWMFEAAEPAVFKWYLKNIAKDVNLFIDNSQIVEFNAWRLGLWGDRDIWKGKKLQYKSR